MDGRRLHAIQMFISWVILIPLAMFCARYYKETYSGVQISLCFIIIHNIIAVIMLMLTLNLFFLQVYFMREFWWYTLHVLLLLNALLFMFGGIFVVRLNRKSDVPWSNEHYLHAIFGYGVMAVFIIHLCVGSFRLHNVYYRMLQIMFHWMFGMLEYIFAGNNKLWCLLTLSWWYAF